MDAFKVQKIIADWVNAGGVAGLDRLHEGLRDSQSIDFGEYGAGEMRCQGLVCVEGQREIRRSGPSANPHTGSTGKGMKWIVYRIRIELCHESTDPDWLAAERAFKEIAEGLLTMVRKDPSLGTAGAPDALFVGAGEGRRGIYVDYSDPFVDQDDGPREQWCHVYFDAPAWITA